MGYWLNGMNVYLVSRALDLMRSCAALMKTLPVGPIEKMDVKKDGTAISFVPFYFALIQSRRASELWVALFAAFRMFDSRQLGAWNNSWSELVH